MKSREELAQSLVGSGDEPKRVELAQKLNGIQVGEEVEFTPVEAHALAIVSDFELEALHLEEQE